jgi:hypothetical protein
MPAVSEAVTFKPLPMPGFVSINLKMKNGLMIEPWSLPLCAKPSKPKTRIAWARRGPSSSVLPIDNLIAGSLACLPP